MGAPAIRKMPDCSRLGAGIDQPIGQGVGQELV